ncbi:MAG: hypothetical protein ACI915_004337 [Gammaproteobacteria bacterium]|jgi:hypothetical protein
MGRYLRHPREVDGQLFEIMNDDKNVVAVLGMEDIKAACAEQNAA